MDNQSCSQDTSFDKPIPKRFSAPWISFSTAYPLSVLVLCCAVAYKLINTPTNITLDFPSLLSLLLALFSVFLSAMFYFKATDTSNAFYDNTYKYTKDIAELLVRIESGFGERLRHLDEGYSNMRDNFDKFHKTPIQETKDEIKESEDDYKIKLEERDKVIEDLISKSKLHDNEKKKYISLLHNVESNLDQKREELSELRKQLSQLESRNYSIHTHRALPEPITPQPLSFLVRRLTKTNSPGELISLKDAELCSRVHHVLSKPGIPFAIISDLIENNIIDNEMTLSPSGAQRLRNYIHRRYFK